MKKIFIIDGNLNYSVSLEAKLRSNNFFVDSADIHLGLGHIFKEVLLRQPDFIISEVVFPLFDGIALLHKLQEDHYTNHIPLAVYTSRANQHLRPRAHSKGVKHFYLKEDFQSHHLISSLAKIYNFNYIA